jgi:ribosome maturation factor RimP
MNRKGGEESEHLEMTYADEMLPRLEALARRAVQPLGVEVAWVEFKRRGSSWVFRVFIDRESGVGLRECEQVSERLGVMLDVEDPIDSRYTLEVSTPGLDRPLRTKRDYVRFSGRLARIKTRERFDNESLFRGRLAGMKDDNVILQGDGETRSFPFSAIESGRLEVEMFQPRPPHRPGKPHSSAKARKRP